MQHMATHLFLFYLVCCFAICFCSSPSGSVSQQAGVQVCHFGKITALTLVSIIESNVEKTVNEGHLLEPSIH